MANEKRLIDANALIEEYDRAHIGEPGKARKLMTEYIERDEAIAEYIKQKIQGGKKSICDSCTHRNVCKAIDNQPCTECNHYQCTDDVIPVRHGKWNDWEVFWKECSCCRYRTQRINVREYFFCPNCGAKMEGGAD